MGAALPRREGDCISAHGGLGKQSGVAANGTRAPSAAGSPLVELVAPNLRSYSVANRSRRRASVEMEF